MTVVHEDSTGRSAVREKKNKAGSFLTRERGSDSIAPGTSQSAGRLLELVHHMGNTEREQSHGAGLVPPVLGGAYGAGNAKEDYVMGDAAGVKKGPVRYSSSAAPDVAKSNVGFETGYYSNSCVKKDEEDSMSMDDGDEGTGYYGRGFDSGDDPVISFSSDDSDNSDGEGGAIGNSNAMGGDTTESGSDDENAGEKLASFARHNGPDASTLETASTLTALSALTGPVLSGADASLLRRSDANAKIEKRPAASKATKKRGRKQSQASGDTKKKAKVSNRKQSIDKLGDMQSGVVSEHPHLEMFTQICQALSGQDVTGFRDNWIKKASNLSFLKRDKVLDVYMDIVPVSPHFPMSFANLCVIKGNFIINKVYDKTGSRYHNTEVHEDNANRTIRANCSLFRSGCQTVQYVMDEINPFSVFYQPAFGDEMMRYINGGINAGEAHVSMAKYCVDKNLQLTFLARKNGYAQFFKEIGFALACEYGNAAAIATYCRYVDDNELYETSGLEVSCCKELVNASEGSLSMKNLPNFVDMITSKCCGTFMFNALLVVNIELIYHFLEEAFLNDIVRVSSFVDDFGRCLTHYAAVVSTRVMKFVVEVKSDCFTEDLFGFSPVDMSCIHGNIESLEVLIRLDHFNAELGKPLALASLFSRRQVVDFIMSLPEAHGLVSYRLGEKKVTPLMCACMSGSNAICARLVSACDVVKGAKQSEDVYGRTVMHYAAMGGFQDQIKILMEGNFDRFAKDKYGNPPCHYAAAFNRPAALTILMPASHPSPVGGNVLDYNLAHISCLAMSVQCFQVCCNKSRGSLKDRDIFGRLPLYYMFTPFEFRVSRLFRKNLLFEEMKKNKWLTDSLKENTDIEGKNLFDYFVSTSKIYNWDHISQVIAAVDGKLPTKLRTEQLCRIVEHKSAFKSIVKYFGTVPTKVDLTYSDFYGRNFLHYWFRRLVSYRTKPVSEEFMSLFAYFFSVPQCYLRLNTKDPDDTADTMLAALTKRDEEGCSPLSYMLKGMSNRELTSPGEIQYMSKLPVGVVLNTILSMLALNTTGDFEVSFFSHFLSFSDLIVCCVNPSVMEFIFDNLSTVQKCESFGGTLMHAFVKNLDHVPECNDFSTLVNSEIGFVNGGDENGATILMHAVACVSVEYAQQIVTLNAELAPDSYGLSVLHVLTIISHYHSEKACKILPIVMQLPGCLELLKSKDVMGRTPMHYLFTKGLDDLKRSKHWLLQRCSNLPYEDNTVFAATLLSIAARNLVDIMQKDVVMFSPIHYCVAQDAPKLLVLICSVFSQIELGGDPTLLECALVCKARSQIIELLLSRNVSIPKHVKGSSTVDILLKRGFGDIAFIVSQKLHCTLYEMAMYSIKHDDSSFTSKYMNSLTKSDISEMVLADGQRSIFHAIGSSPWNKVSEIFYRFAAKHFSEQINFKDAEGDTALHLACYWSDTETIRRLLVLGADIGIKNNTMMSPIQYAISKFPTVVADRIRIFSNIEVLLTDKSAGMKLETLKQPNAVMLAVQKNSPGLIDLLYREGDVDIFDHEPSTEKTALMMAVDYNLPEIVSIIFDLGNFASNLAKGKHALGYLKVRDYLTSYDSHGRNILHHCAMSSSFLCYDSQTTLKNCIEPILLNKDILTELISKRDIDGNTPQMYSEAFCTAGAMRGVYSTSGFKKVTNRAVVNNLVNKFAPDYDMSEKSKELTTKPSCLVSCEGTWHVLETAQGNDARQTTIDKFKRVGRVIAFLKEMRLLALKPFLAKNKTHMAEWIAAFEKVIIWLPLLREHLFSFILDHALGNDNVFNDITSLIMNLYSFRSCLTLGDGTLHFGRFTGNDAYSGNALSCEFRLVREEENAHIIQWFNAGVHNGLSEYEPVATYAVCNSANAGRRCVRDRSRLMYLASSSLSKKYHADKSKILQAEEEESKKEGEQGQDAPMSNQVHNAAKFPISFILNEDGLGAITQEYCSCDATEDKKSSHFSNLSFCPLSRHAALFRCGCNSECSCSDNNLYLAIAEIPESAPGMNEKRTVVPAGLPVLPTLEDPNIDLCPLESEPNGVLSLKLNAILPAVSADRGPFHVEEHSLLNRLVSTEKYKFKYILHISRPHV
eukprot:Nk52_evm17s207 gene=Nk52_evmTU17s207